MASTSCWNFPRTLQEHFIVKKDELYHIISLIGWKQEEFWPFSINIGKYTFQTSQSCCFSGLQIITFLAQHPLWPWCDPDKFCAKKEKTTETLWLKRRALLVIKATYTYLNDKLVSTFLFLWYLNKETLQPSPISYTLLLFLTLHSSPIVILVILNLCCYSQQRLIKKGFNLLDDLIITIVQFWVHPKIFELVLLTQEVRGIFSNHKDACCNIKRGPARYFQYNFGMKDKREWLWVAINSQMWTLYQSTVRLVNKQRRDDVCS